MINTIPQKHISVKAKIGGSLISLTVNGEQFSFEPCRPGYLNLVNTKTNKVLGVIPDNTRINEAILIATEAAKEKTNAIN